MGRSVKFWFGSSVVVVNIASQTALLAAVSGRFAARQGFALATLNLDHLVKLRQSKAFRRAYAAQNLIVADGNPIVWLSRLAGNPVALLPGADLIDPLARLAAQSCTKVALIGSTQTALDAAASRLQQRIPGLTIVFCHAPAMGFDPEGAAAAKVLASLEAQDIGLCFVALGAPKQEMFAAFGRTIAPNVGFVSIGAGVDFIAGNQTRAPVWVRTIAMEWAWRAITSPLRLVPRYAACALILPGQIAAALKLRFKSGQ